MQGRPLGATIADDTPVREAALFGLHGGHVNVTDGRYVYMRAPTTADNQPLFNYTLMPTHMRARFSVDELQTIDLADSFPFTKGCRTLQVPAQRWPGSHPYQTLLFDLHKDPKQESPMDDRDIDPAVKQAMIEHLLRLMKENDAPKEQFARLGLLDQDQLQLRLIVRPSALLLRVPEETLLEKTLQETNPYVRGTCRNHEGLYPLGPSQKKRR